MIAWPRFFRTRNRNRDLSNDIERVRAVVRAFADANASIAREREGLLARIGEFQANAGFIDESAEAEEAGILKSIETQIRAGEKRLVELKEFSGMLQRYERELSDRFITPKVAEIEASNRA